jgi:hypothetical protein
MVFSIILVELKFMINFQCKKGLPKSNNQYPGQVTPCLPFTSSLASLKARCPTKLRCSSKLKMLSNTMCQKKTRKTINEEEKM